MLAISRTEVLWTRQKGPCIHSLSRSWCLCLVSRKCLVLQHRIAFQQWRQRLSWNAMCFVLCLWEIVLESTWMRHCDYPSSIPWLMVAPIISTGQADFSPGSGNGSPMYFVNSWALGWAYDMWIKGICWGNHFIDYTDSSQIWHNTTFCARASRMHLYIGSSLRLTKIPMHQIRSQTH